MYAIDSFLVSLCWQQMRLINSGLWLSGLGAPIEAQQQVEPI